MARGPSKWNESTIERMQLDGCGKGEGKDYKPWITVRDISSNGYSHRIWGIKTGREHHKLSNVERDIFIWAEWIPYVVDIREQFPLDRALTQEIAAACGIRHPYYPGTFEPTVMTVDLLLTLILNGKKALLAINAKTSTEAEDEGALCKLEIQRRYFTGMDIPHRIIFDTQIPAQQVSNITWIRNAYLKPGEYEPYKGFFDEQQQLMITELAHGSRNQILADYCLNYDMRHGIEQGYGLRIARMLMYSRALKADLNNPDLPNAPLASFIVTAQPGRLRKVK